MSTQVKKWYESKLIGLGAVAVLGAAADGLSTGMTWRQIAVASLGAVVIVLRAWFTKKELSK